MNELRVVRSPTENWQIRSDPAGDGKFMAPRGHRLHLGRDFPTEEYDRVFAPICGVAERRADPYATDRRWGGLLIKGHFLWAKLFYLDPLPSVIGDTVDIGDIIGHAQDITIKYPNQGMTPHIHMQLCVPPMRAISHRNSQIIDGPVFIDPDLFNLTLV